MGFEAQSWDEIFGKPNDGRRKVAALKRHEQTDGFICLRVEYLRAKKPKPKDIFGIVAKEFKMSSKLCEQRYYVFKNFYFGDAELRHPKQVPTQTKKNT